jgi:hypothetical protein
LSASHSPHDHGITLGEVQQLFRDIERGAVTVTPEVEPDEVYAGNVGYRTSNGWTIVVFNDCAEFDYVDSVIAPDGRECDAWHQEMVRHVGGDITYEPPDPTAEWLKNYTPPDDQEQSIWRIRV